MRRVVLWLVLSFTSGGCGTIRELLDIAIHGAPVTMP